MATVTVANPDQAAPALPAPSAATATRGNPRVMGLRSRMMTLLSASVALGLLLGLIAWQANLNTYNDYRTLVDEGSVSVDAALRARAAALDHMAAAATYLETTGPAQSAAANRANQLWATFNNEARISWRNLTDRTYGENNVYGAADRAASSYIQQIGAMFSYSRATPPQPEQAREAFLQARETLNTRLVPALGGLEAVKVEAMEATYAGASERITRWRWALAGVAALALLVFGGSLLAVRRMRYRWSWPLGVALLLTGGLAFLMQWQLGQASSDAEVMVRRAYDNVAGAQGLGALLSQARALESIAIFDPQGAEGHLESFEQYNALVEQGLCGPRLCTQNSFLAGSDSVDSGVRDRALDTQDTLGLPRPPLVANVHFRGQAAALEALRVEYRLWFDSHQQLATDVRGGGSGRQAAASRNTGVSADTFANVVARIGSLTDLARTEFNNIWQRVYALSTLAQILAVAFPLSGLLAAYGIWRRRSELFA